PADGTAGDGPPPTGPVEHAIAKVWREVLGVPNVGALDDFFALGGDSIRSLKVIARLRRLGYRVAVGELFGKPTVRALAAALDVDPAPPAEPVTAPEAPAFGLVNPRDLALLEQRFGESTS
ncbi:MAG TPA: phosphopantetheine-binding protein, partial [Pseudonocardiaceae bacterium]|nr:phosphopantetheine-binding protein [Pseudonocardiaceae bacterium]